ncbi:Uncharacterised protein [Vibrio furnissii]|nr:Uncharacterised protein [Vibrio furnissii]
MCFPGECANAIALSDTFATVHGDKVGRKALVRGACFPVLLYGFQLLPHDFELVIWSYDDISQFSGHRD